MRRVAVIGSGGAGKSTLARELAWRVDLPVVHLDEYYWRPGWQASSPTAWQERQRHLVAGEAWIIDGNYLSTLELRLSAADTVVFLDLSRWRCAWRATRRVLTRHGRPNTAAGCPERLGYRHLRFLAYVWSFPSTGRPAVLERLAKHQQTTTILRLTTPSQVRQFLHDL